MLQKTSFDKCQVCGDDAHVHIHLARNRKWVETQHRCVKHYDDAIEDVFEREPIGPHAETGLESATRFEVEMLFFQVQKQDGLCYLLEVGGSKRFWCTMDYCGAAALYWHLHPSAPSHLGTHHTLAKSIGALGGNVLGVTIDECDSTAGFRALLHMERIGEVLVVDARPSDAINLAAVADVPIWVSKEAYAKRLRNRSL